MKTKKIYHIYRADIEDAVKRFNGDTVKDTIEECMPYFIDRIGTDDGDWSLNQIADQAGVIFIRMPKENENNIIKEYPFLFDGVMKDIEDGVDFHIEYFESFSTIYSEPIIITPDELQY